MGQITEKAAAALERAERLADEANRIFVQLDRARILADAAALDAQREHMQHLPLYGITVSLKDLFDEQGQRSTAASLILKDRPPAKEDGVVVQRLRAAGALFFGRTSLSEFAYSGLGLNPHYGTPGCIFDSSLIPGGSSSGAALSVAHQLCDIGMGTDTGGSVRLPAAVNGLYGFKPTAHTVSTTGVHPLSTTYDSVGPLTTSLQRTVQCLNIIRDEPLALADISRPLNLAVPAGAFCADLDASVASAFQNQLDTLAAAGHNITELAMHALDDWTVALRMTVSYEAQSQYKPYLQALETQGDPNVLGRIHLSDGMTEADLAGHQKQRQQAIAWFNNQLRGYDALLAPTTKCERPAIADASADFVNYNGAVLRNTTYINLVNGCGLTLPVERGDSLPPAALMVCGPENQDATVLSASRVIDQLLNPEL
ncbi:MAG: amidase family protein [Granulosicoccus sp.]